MGCAVGGWWNCSDAKLQYSENNGPSTRLGFVQKKMTMRLKYDRNLVCWLSCLLLFQGTLSPLLKAEDTSPPSVLNIVVVDGEGAINHISQRTARDPVVRIEDEHQRPLAGATVVFTLPTGGTSGEFSGSKTTTVMTDKQGLVTVRGLKVNNVPGTLQIHVNASYRGVRARTTITQFNMQMPGMKAGGSGKLIAILAIVGAGAAGGAVLAMQRGSKGSTPSAGVPGVAAIGITAGAGSVGAPH
jgi:hypothetical protein